MGGGREGGHNCWKRLPTRRPDICSMRHSVASSARSSSALGGTASLPVLCGPSRRPSRSPDRSTPRTSDCGCASASARVDKPVPQPESRMSGRSPAASSHAVSSPNASCVCGGSGWRSRYRSREHACCTADGPASSCGSSGYAAARLPAAGVGHGGATTGVKSCGLAARSIRTLGAKTVVASHPVLDTKATPT